MLEKSKYTYEVMVISAHRNPGELDITFQALMQRSLCNCRFIGSLPGFVASKTKKPVVGFPVSAKLGGLDALLSIAQMPKGVPVEALG